MNMSEPQKPLSGSKPAAKEKLQTDHPLSEKDEVKQAEHKTAKQAAKHESLKSKTRDGESDKS